MFVDTVFTDKKFIEEFYNDTIFSGPVRYEIVYKYLSIDSLLYNQLKLEGLFKDYKWNNPSLSNIKNNIMIKNLKKI